MGAPHIGGTDDLPAESLWETRIRFGAIVVSNSQVQEIRVANLGHEEGGEATKATALGTNEHITKQSQVRGDARS